jgi:hypothetical protein
MSPQHSLLITLAALAAAILPAPAAAASTIDLRLGGPALEDRPFTVLAEGVAQNDREWNTSNLTAKIKELRAGATCGPDFFTDAGSTVSLGYAVATGPYRVPLQITVDSPGKWLLCVWFDSVSADSHRHDSLVVDVRGPKNGLTVSAPSVVRKGRPAVVKLRGSAELPRLLLTKLVRGRTSCGQAYASELESPSLTAVRPVRDAIRLDVRTRMLKRPGVYTICAYVQEQIDEPRAELVARRLVRVR